MFQFVLKINISRAERFNFRQKIFFYRRDIDFSYSIIMKIPGKDGLVAKEGKRRDFSGILMNPAPAAKVRRRAYPLVGG